MVEIPNYKNLISHIDIDRDINSIVYFDFLLDDYKTKEFLEDMNSDNDIIEKSLINSNAYKEAVILSLKKTKEMNNEWANLLKEEQKTFSGSKLFYLNKEFTKILVLSVPGNTDGKLKMVINRLSKINDKISKFNLQIKKNNSDAFNKRIKNKDKKDKIVNIVNLNLRV